SELGLILFIRGRNVRINYRNYEVKSIAVKAQPTAEEMTELNKQQEEYQEANEEYQKKLKFYNRNVSIFAMAAAVIIVITSLLLLSKIILIADGLLLGSVLSLGYSVVRGFMTEDNTYRFLAVSVSLAVALTIGYFRFIRGNKEIPSR
ncbi:MAG: hypothetical protein WC459_00005, partial [Patescibacteria group bacterium]